MDRDALVPGFGEGRQAPDDLGKSQHGLSQSGHLHLLGAALVKRVNGADPQTDSRPATTRQPRTGEPVRYRRAVWQASCRHPPFFQFHPGVRCRRAGLQPTGRRAPEAPGRGTTPCPPLLRMPACSGAHAGVGAAGPGNSMLGGSVSARGAPLPMPGVGCAGDGIEVAPPSRRQTKLKREEKGLHGR